MRQWVSYGWASATLIMWVFSRRDSSHHAQAMSMGRLFVPMGVLRLGWMTKLMREFRGF